MGKFITKKNFLILILIIAAFLRFWHLNNVPPSASMDETSIGYNAYSVLKTGLDEYGSFPLISQRGYDDWRRSTYLFFTIPFIALLNLNVIAIRLPAAIMSVISVYAVYRIVLLLFNPRSKLAEYTALATAFLMAISPWHVYISRLGHESNAYLSFFIFGTLFFLLWLKEKKKLFLSLLFFTLALVSYYSGQATVPLFGLGILFIYRKQIISIIYKDKKNLVILFMYILILIPVLWSVFNPAALIRFQGTSTFTSEAHPDIYSDMVMKRNQAAASYDLIGTFIYNRRFYPVKVFIDGYLSHFNPQWLFFNSGADQFKIPNLGFLYIWEIPLLLFGIVVFIFRNDWSKENKILIFLWFFIAPIPAAIATQAPHGLRTNLSLVTWQIFAAIGTVYLIGYLKKFKYIVLPFLIIVISLSLYSLYQNYFYVFPKEQSESFDYALSKAIPYVLTLEDKYSNIVFANNNNLSQSYMLYLYYSKYDPRLYQSEGGTKSGGYAETHHIGKYLFRPINWQTETLTNALYVGNVTDFPKGTQFVKTFYSLDGKATIEMALK